MNVLTNEDLFLEACDVAHEQGVSSPEMWHGVVDEIIDGHVDLGEIHLDQNTEQLKENLRSRWNEYKEKMGKPGE